MAKPTIAQLEAVVASQANDIAIAHEAITALSHQLARLEQQVAHLQLGNKEQPQALVADPCASVQNWKMEYAKYRAITGKAPTADDVRAWIRAGRPGA